MEGRSPADLEKNKSAATNSNLQIVSLLLKEKCTAMTMASTKFVTFHEEGAVYFWDLENFTLLISSLRKGPGFDTNVVFVQSLVGDVLLVLDNSGELAHNFLTLPTSSSTKWYAYQLSSGIKIFNGWETTCVLKFSSSLIARGLKDGKIYISNCNSPGSYQQSMETESQVNKLLAPASHLIVSGHENGDICYWNMTTWSIRKKMEEAVIEKTSSAVTSLLTLPNGRFISGHKNGSIYVWNSTLEEKTAKRITVLEDKEASPVVSLGVLPNGEILCSHREKFKRLNSETLTFVDSIAFEQPLKDVQILEDNKLCALLESGAVWFIPAKYLLEHPAYKDKEIKKLDDSTVFTELPSRPSRYGTDHRHGGPPYLELPTEGIPQNLSAFWQATFPPLKKKTNEAQQTNAQQRVSRRPLRNRNDNPAPPPPNRGLCRFL